MAQGKYKDTNGSLVEALQGVELFSGVGDKDLELLSRHFVLKTYPRGERLFSENDAADGLFIVTQGFCGVLVASGSSGEEKEVVLLGRGLSIGEMAWVDRGKRSGSVVAASDPVQVAWVPYETLDLYCRKHPRAGYRIMRNIAADLSFRLRQQTHGGG